MECSQHCFARIRSGLTGLHPLTHFSVAVTLSIISFAGFSTHIPYIIFVGIQCPLALFGGVFRKLCKRGAVIVVPYFVFLFAIYGLVYPEGETILFSWWIVAISQEGVNASYRVFGRVLVVVIAFLYFSIMVKPSKLVQALSLSGIPWFIGYILLATLQTIPLLSSKAAAITDAQRTRGLDTDSNMVNRIKSIVPLLKPLIFSSIVKAQERAFFLESNGASLRGNKTYLYDLIDYTWEKAFRKFCIVISVMCLVHRLWLTFI